MELVKELIPEGGVAGTPLEALRQAREVLAEDGRWLQGGMMSSNGDVEDIVENGLCGKGWAVCAFGAVAMACGLTAALRGGRPHGEEWMVLSSLVDEDGDPKWGIEPPTGRWAVYVAAVEALNSVTAEKHGVWMLSIINDAAPGVHVDNPLAAVLDIFDETIERAEADENLFAV